jgi:antitoxin MazE
VSSFSLGLLFLASGYRQRRYIAEKYLDYFDKSNYIVSTICVEVKMITKVVKIGNSRGIRIPKSFIDQSGIKNEVELEVKDDRIIIKSLSEVRKNWNLAFQKMSENNDDTLLDQDSLNSQSSWDEEWTW